MDQNISKKTLFQFLSDKYNHRFNVEVYTSFVLWFIDRLDFSVSFSPSNQCTKTYL